MDTLGGIVSCEVSEDASVISVEMGQVSFHSGVVPVKLEGEAREVLDEPIEIGGRSLRYYAATIGNPHCVVPTDDLSEKLTRDLGPVLENHPNFPNRTNVQFLKVIDRNRIRIEIWERGAGYTLASGSSSSAAGAVARKMGTCDEKITVEMPGGEIGLIIDDEFKRPNDGTGDPGRHHVSGQRMPLVNRLAGDPKTTLVRKLLYQLGFVGKS